MNLLPYNVATNLLKTHQSGRKVKFKAIIWSPSKQAYPKWKLTISRSQKHYFCHKKNFPPVWIRKQILTNKSLCKIPANLLNIKPWCVVKQNTSRHNSFCMKNCSISRGMDKSSTRSKTLWMCNVTVTPFGNGLLLTMWVSRAKERKHLVGWMLIWLYTIVLQLKV